MSKECPFKIGDKIRHKASHQLAVVRNIRTKCVKHTFFEHTQINVWKLTGQDNKHGECEYTFTGWIEIGLGLEDKTKVVKASEFEKV